MKINRHVQTFHARSADGRAYVIHVSQDFTTTDSFDGDLGLVPGLKSYRTQDGQRVNYREKGYYRIIGKIGDIDVTSDDPNAP